MKYYFTVFVFIFITVTSFSQETQGQCGTLAGYTDMDTTLVPWYGNNAILYEYLEQHKYLFEGTDRAEERNSDPCASEIRNPFSIPIRFYVWLASNETPAVVSPSDLNAYIDGVNQGFASNGFNTNFYMYCPIYITNNDLVDLENNSDTYFLTTGGNSGGFAINIHIIRSSPGWAGQYNGVSDNITITRTSSPITLIHEIGHYFGLEHTHKFTEDPGCCKREPVTRGKKWAQACLFCLFTNIPVNNRRCSRTGDYLCDTEADPSGTSDSCVYAGGLTDGYGEAFHPDTRNYMSYYNNICKNQFSQQQKGIIAGAIRYWMYTVDDAVLDPDKYEPDDPYATIFGTPKIITIGETQCHSIHNYLVEQSCEDS